MSGSMRITLAPLCLAVSLCMVVPPALAQMVDPTQPPPQAMLTPGASVAPVVPPGPQLQSVLVSTKPGGRRLAVIDGQTVRLGGKIDGAVLVKVTDKEVVLQRGKSTQVLTLFPPVDLRPAGVPAAATATAPAKPGVAPAAKPAATGAATGGMATPAVPAAPAPAPPPPPKLPSASL